MTDTTSLEVKSADADDHRAFDEFLEGFEAFKETNDRRIGEIEQRGSADVLTQEKLARIEEALDTNKRISDSLAIKAQRPHLSGIAYDPAQTFSAQVGVRRLRAPR